MTDYKMENYSQIDIIAYINSNDILSKALNYYLKYNTNISNPYHNLNHTFEMMDMMKKMVDYNIYNNIDILPDNISIVELMLCALFHDFNHSGGKFNDEINIHNAILGLKDFLKNYDNEYIINEYACIEIVKATQYPYIIKDSDLTIPQRIIRECDILCIFHNDIFTQTLLGLQQEMCIKDYNSLLDNYYNFIMESIKNLKLQYSIYIVNKNIDEFVNLIKILRNIIK